MAQQTISDIVASASLDLSPYEDLYIQFHQNPELSNQEKETAATVAGLLSKFGVFDIHTNVGGHGLAAIWKNGPGNTVMLRADMDALPVEEKTGLPYASTKKMLDAGGQERPVMHACGHDMHMTCLLAGTLPDGISDIVITCADIDHSDRHSRESEGIMEWYIDIDIPARRRERNRCTGNG